MEDENKNQILKAVKENDVETLRKVLKNPFGYRLGQEEIPILSMAVKERARDVIKFLIDSGCDVWESDNDGNTALHLLLTDYGVSTWTNGLEIVDILLTASSNFVEGLFVKANNRKMTPFLLACALGDGCDETQLECDAIVERFMALLEANSITIPIVQLIGDKGNNIFHLLCDSRCFVPSPARLAAVRALIDKFPCDSLIDSKNYDGQTPFDVLLFSGGLNDRNVVVEIAKLFFQHGASPDTLVFRYGYSYLEPVMDVRNEALIEVLLRAGCSTDLEQDSALRLVLSYYRWSFPHLESNRIIEWLLAFGFDLKNEPYLYAIDERPIKFTSPEYAAVCDTSDMDPNVLEALREIRRSNKLLSLKRQCRKTIRRHLKGKADMVIGNLTCIPDRIKSFLLVENEQPLLELP